MEECNCDTVFVNLKKSVAHVVVRTINVIVVNKFGSLKYFSYIVTKSTH